MFGDEFVLSEVGDHGYFSNIILIFFKNIVALWTDCSAGSLFACGRV